uniref:Transmembrane protein n=1 Tax=Neospora caninum (strain Liverpool) TaxID=572307 RepID=A0A0F7US77_NEOCL|nr:TPA: hypothetical protein BN1204_065955 [Neospora caninum Liverpool]
MLTRHSSKKVKTKLAATMETTPEVWEGETGEDVAKERWQAGLDLGEGGARGQRTSEKVKARKRKHAFLRRPSLPRLSLHSDEFHAKHECLHISEERCRSVKRTRQRKMACVPSSQISFCEGSSRLASWRSSAQTRKLRKKRRVSLFRSASLCAILCLLWCLSLAETARSVSLGRPRQGRPFRCNGDSHCGDTRPSFRVSSLSRGGESAQLDRLCVLSQRVFSPLDLLSSLSPTSPSTLCRLFSPVLSSGPKRPSPRSPVPASAVPSVSLLSCAFSFFPSSQSLSLRSSSPPPSPCLPSRLSSLTDRLTPPGTPTHLPLPRKSCGRTTKPTRSPSVSPLLFLPSLRGCARPSTRKARHPTQRLPCSSFSSPSLSAACSPPSSSHPVFSSPPAASRLAVSSSYLSPLFSSSPYLLGSLPPCVTWPSTCCFPSFASLSSSACLPSSSSSLALSLRALPEALLPDSTDSKPASLWEHANRAVRSLRDYWKSHRANLQHFDEKDESREEPLAENTAEFASETESPGGTNAASEEGTTEAEKATSTHEGTRHGAEDGEGAKEREGNEQRQEKKLICKRSRVSVMRLVKELRATVDPWIFAASVSLSVLVSFASFRRSFLTGRLYDRAASSLTQPVACTRPDSSAQASFPLTCPKVGPEQTQSIRQALSAVLRRHLVTLIFPSSSAQPSRSSPSPSLSSSLSSFSSSLSPSLSCPSDSSLSLSAPSVAEKRGGVLGCLREIAARLPLPKSTGAAERTKASFFSLLSTKGEEKRDTPQKRGETRTRHHAFLALLPLLGRVAGFSCVELVGCVLRVSRRGGFP